MSSRKKIKTLEDLKKLKLDPKDDFPAHLKKPEKVKEPQKTEVNPEAEEDLFANAMRGVDRMGPESGRQVTPRPVVTKKTNSIDSEAQALKDFVEGNIDFELEYTDEYLYGFVKGLDSKIFQQLKAGSLSCQGHLDMHGLNTEQAHENLLFFVRESYLQNKRCLLIVTGRGKNSPGGRGVLRQEVQTWLTKDPLRRIVLAFCTAQPKDGGPGAIYALLRKQKKTKGKVQWDKNMNWDDK